MTQDRVAYITNQAMLMRAQAAWCGDTCSAEPSVDRLAKSLDTLDAGDPRRAGIAYNLGRLQDDDSYLELAANLVSGPPHIRLRAAREWGTRRWPNRNCRPR